MIGVVKKGNKISSIKYNAVHRKYNSRPGFVTSLVPKVSFLSKSGEMRIEKSHHYAKFEINTQLVKQMAETETPCVFTLVPLNVSTRFMHS